MEKIQIIHSPSKEKPFLIINKPKGLASAPLNPDDKNNALAQVLELYPECKNVKGKKDIEFGLLHRLDTVTDGLMIIAANQEVYDFLQNEQKEGKIIKTYQAVCNISNETSDREGFPPLNVKITQDFKITSYFRAFGKGGKEVRPVTEDSGKAALQKIGKRKLYTTNVKILEKTDKKCRVECTISEGYRHQVRCHLAWAGLPIENDPLYNPDKKNAEEPIKFSATKIMFEYPKGDLNSYEITFTWT